ncbi:MAG: GlsB/YeaQ/YmgE family stress response membrane protein [Alphaproteobacteria bacterium]
MRPHLYNPSVRRVQLDCINRGILGSIIHAIIGAIILLLLLRLIKLA